MAEPEIEQIQSSEPAMRKATVGVITVTHNSERFFNKYIAALEAQTRRPDLVVLVDSGSTQPAFLNVASSCSVQIEVLRESNVGYCAGNNIGWRRIRGFDYVIFLNPDAFLEQDFIEKAVEYMDSHPGVGMVTPTLIRYDIEKHRVMDVIDTTGVVRNWHGFPERDKSKPVEYLKHYLAPNRISWLCTAVAMGRREAMEAVVEPGDQLFDESFFMYKEDTDLSWRVRRAGWHLIHHPQLMGYHCRGWQSRRAMSRKMRLLSARNEVKMCWKNRSPFLLVIMLKFALVRCFDL